jgi:hypothetical protein
MRFTVGKNDVEAFDGFDAVDLSPIDLDGIQSVFGLEVENSQLEFLDLASQVIAILQPDLIGLIRGQ